MGAPAPAPTANRWTRISGAIFDPFGNAVHTALSFPLVGEDVLITGAGPIGLMAAAVCRHVGARFVVVTDVADYRLDLARRMGVDLGAGRVPRVDRGLPATARHGRGLQRRAWR